MMFLPHVFPPKVFPLQEGAALLADVARRYYAGMSDS